MYTQTFKTTEPLKGHKIPDGKIYFNIFDFALKSFAFLRETLHPLAKHTVKQ